MAQPKRRDGNSFRHAAQLLLKRTSDRTRSTPWKLFRLGSLLVVVAFGIPLTGSTQEIASALERADELPNAPGRGESSQTSSSQSSVPESSAGVFGAIRDTNGSVIVGATVVLSGQNIGERVGVSDGKGEFTFAGLPEGAFQVTIAAAGFETFVSGEILLGPGERRELPATDLAVAVTNTDVQVTATRDDIAEAEVKLAEKQRVFGILPNFYSSYIWDAAPLSPKLKFQLALRSTTDPVVFMVTGGLAGVEQAHNTFPGYDRGPGGYARRYGAAYADNVIGRMLGSAILPTIFHQDPRYFYKGKGSIPSRALYAIGETVVTRGDNGHRQPNYSHILGNFAAAGLSNLYRSSDDRSASLTIRNGFIITGSNAVANLVREFLLRKITSKVPDFEQGKP